MNQQDQSAALSHSPVPSSRRSHSFATAMIFLFSIFLVLFPKGGLKIGNIPLTWGYMLIAMTAPFLLAFRLIELPLIFRKASLLAFSSILPFQLLFFYSYRANGSADLGSIISDLVSLLVLPFLFLLIYPAFYPRIDGALLARLLRFCVLGAAIFGIFLFIEYPLTGHLLEIPFLTVNVDDYGLIASTKHINRGFFLKLISTYNNGNVYGVATLILLPLYDRLEQHAWRRHTVRLALVLTLSRTVWIGLVLDQLLSFARDGVLLTRTFPRILAGRTLRRAGAVLFTLLAVLLGSILSAGNLAFLLDSSLGGRREGLAEVVQTTTFLPAVPVGGFIEIIYLSALRSYGVFGLLTFTLIFVFPIVLLLINPAAFRSPLRLAAIKGLIIYMIVAVSDGAINLIPVMAFYWFAYMIFLEGWPGEAQLAAADFPAKVAETCSSPADTLGRDSEQNWSAIPG